MVQSTDGQLSYGVVFDEDFEFPWDAEQWEGDIEEWWRDVKGFSNPMYYPFDQEGDYEPGYNCGSPEVGDYFRYRREWLESNPIPIEVVNYCSCDCPQYLLASRHMSCSRGRPQEVSVEFLRETDEAFQDLAAFLDEYDIKSENEASWWLTSYWD